MGGPVREGAGGLRRKRWSYLGGIIAGQKGGNAMAEINVGDVVRLKSGGPKMTVAKIGVYHGGVAQATCHWFAGDKVETGLFPLAALEKVEQSGQEQGR